jgi:CheY-like chemotaxis protein
LECAAAARLRRFEITPCHDLQCPNVEPIQNSKFKIFPAFLQAPIWLDAIPLLMTRSQHAPKKVLIVDDDTTVLRLIGATMSSVGHEIGTATDGVEGLMRFREQRWDVVITDRAMPHMDGEEMTSAIKASAPNVPVILITGLRDSVTRESQYDAILCKPFRGDDLQVLVEKALERQTPQPC